jgi:nucleoside-diphosphate-sugar epimerase
MNILITGGTGAMGTPMITTLSKNVNNQIYITSRASHIDKDNIHYIQGNAADSDFLKDVLVRRKYDVLVDFVLHKNVDFKMLFDFILNHVGQYIYISSARVYAQSNKPITENTPRLLDVSTDQEFLKTNEYALKKAREEDLLLNSGYTNFTIIRPSITYNNKRLQLGVFEKEEWLYRVLHGRSIVFSDDVVDKLTTMTWGNDVSDAICNIIGNEQAKGQIYHITYNQSLLWRDVLNIYVDVLKRNGYNPKVVFTSKSTNFIFPDKKYQLIYCRYFNRTFDNSKISQFVNVATFKSPQVGLSECLENFLKSPKFRAINWRLEAENDRVCNERTSLTEMPLLHDKLIYLVYRYNLSWILKIKHLFS